MAESPDPPPTFDQRNQHVEYQVNIAGDAILPSPPAPPLWVDVPDLPPHPLIGRDDLLADLVAGLTGGQSKALSTDGQGGAGKTALAVALAHDERVRAHFTGGVLWAGLGLTPNPTTVLNGWGDALGLAFAPAVTDAQRRQAIATALGDRRVLVVLDDGWAQPPLDALRLNTPGAIHLLTTRAAGLARAFAGKANQRHVPELDADPAYTLLAALAPEACAADPVQARRLVALVGGLPLAIVVLAGYLNPNAGTEERYFADEQGDALAEAGDPAKRLSLACARLGAASSATVTLAQVIELSLHDLPETTRAAFYALGAFAPKPAEFDAEAAQAVTGADLRTLGQLIDRNLLEIRDGTWLALHQVVADVARVGTPEEAVTAHDAYYLGVVDADREDWQRIEGVYNQAQHAMQRLAQDDALIVHWGVALSVFWKRRGLGAEYIRWAEQTLTRAEALDNVKIQAVLLNNIGKVYADLGAPQQALTYYHRALPRYRQVSDRLGEAATLNNIGAVYSALGDHRQALDYYTQALPLFRQVGDQAGEAATLNNIGMVYLALSNPQRALDHYNQALPLFRQIGDRSGEAYALNNIGMIYFQRGELATSFAHAAQATELWYQMGDRLGEILGRRNLAYAANRLGDHERAITELQQAIALAAATGHPNLDTLQAMLAEWSGQSSTPWQRLTRFFKRKP